MAHVAVLITIATLSLQATASAATGTTIDKELETAMTALRRRGYTLFANAISTSELRYLLHSSTVTTADTKFTLFGPRDASLFALDMSTTASEYVRTLRYHVAPYRLSFSDLRNLSRGGASMETLLPRHRLLITKSNVSSNDTVLDIVTVDGVRILVPDLYIGSGFAVHGLDGILVARFPSKGKFPGDLGFVSPSASPQKCLLISIPHGSNDEKFLGNLGFLPFASPQHCLPIPPSLNRIDSVSLPPEKNVLPETNLGLGLTKPQKQNDRLGFHGVDEENYGDGIGHDNFSKFNRHFFL